MHTILCKENAIEGAAQALFFYLKKKGVIFMMTYEIVGKCPNCGKRIRIYVRLENEVQFNITEIICQHCGTEIEEIETFIIGGN